MCDKFSPLGLYQTYGYNWNESSKEKKQMVGEVKVGN